MGAAEHHTSRSYCVARRRAQWAVWLLLVTVMAWAPRAGAVVSCTNPDNLCRGNPCVTGPIEVLSPCEVDFGDRVLVIGGTMKVPNGGVLKLRAGSIEVRRAIVGRHTNPVGGAGASIELTAVNDLAVRWRLDASARILPGSIKLTAGGNIQILAPLRAATGGVAAKAGGGAIEVTAGGSIRAIRRARMRVDGEDDTAGGTLVLQGGDGVNLDNRIDAEGKVGGRVRIGSLRGSIASNRRVNAVGLDGNGGSVVMLAEKASVTVRDSIEVDGTTDGGAITLVSPNALTTSGLLHARGSSTSGGGGNVLLVSNAGVSINEAIYAGGARGGRITAISRAGTLRASAPLLAQGRDSTGGTIRLTGQVAAVVESTVDADGRETGGDVDIDGALVTLSDRSSVTARGDAGGTVDVRGGGVVVQMGARVLVDADLPGGSIRFVASNGDLTLSGNFRARGEIGGRIQGAASRKIVANGEFEADGNGCIAFSGSTVDLSGGEFDVPVASSCP